MARMAEATFPNLAIDKQLEFLRSLAECVKRCGTMAHRRPHDCRPSADLRYVGCFHSPSAPIYLANERLTTGVSNVGILEVMLAVPAQLSITTASPSSPGTVTQHVVITYQCTS